MGTNVYSSQMGQIWQMEETILLKFHLVNRCVCSGHGYKQVKRYFQQKRLKGSRDTRSPPAWVRPGQSCRLWSSLHLLQACQQVRESLSGSSAGWEPPFFSNYLLLLWTWGWTVGFLYVSAFLDFWVFFLLLLLLDLQKGCLIERRSPHNNIGITRNILSPISQGLPTL